MDKNEKNFEILMRKNEQINEEKNDSSKPKSKYVTWVILGCFSIIAIIVVIFAISGESRNGKPNDVSQEMYDLAVYAIKIADRYLDGEDSIEETYEKLESISLPEITFDYSGQYKKDTSVNTAISHLQSSAFSIKLGSKGIGSANMSDFKKARDELAEKINYKD